MFKAEYKTTISELPGDYTALNSCTYVDIGDESSSPKQSKKDVLERPHPLGKRTVSDVGPHLKKHKNIKFVQTLPANFTGKQYRQTLPSNFTGFMTPLEESSEESTDNSIESPTTPESPIVSNREILTNFDETILSPKIETLFLKKKYQDVVQLFQPYAESINTFLREPRYKSITVVFSIKEMRIIIMSSIGTLYR